MDPCNEQQLEKVERALHSREMIMANVGQIISDPGKANVAMMTVESDPRMKRFALQMADNPDIKRQVRSVPSSEKRRAQKIELKRRANADVKVPRLTEGVKIVQMKCTGVCRPAFYPEKRVDDWVRFDIPSTNISCIYNPKDQCRNRKATKICGKPIVGNVFFFRLIDGGVSELLLDDFTRLS